MERSLGALLLRLDHLQLMLSFVIGIEWVARAW